MSELMLINPKKRGKKRSHKKRAAKAHHNPTRRRRRRPVRARRHARRYRNPSIRQGIMSGLPTALGVAGGAIGTNVATGALLKYVPGVPAVLQSGIGKTALKIGVGVVALPMLLKATGQGKHARNVATGAWAAVILDLWAAYAAPALGLGDYEFLTGYQELGPENTALGALADGENEAMGAYAGDNMYADTMYGFGGM